VNNQNILIGCTYRPPDQSHKKNHLDLFNSEFSKILKSTDCGKKKTVSLASDYNLDLLNYDSHGPTADFFNNLFSYSYLPAIKYPTRITEHSKTLLDNVFVNLSIMSFDSVILFNDISDHLPVAIHLMSVLARRKEGFFPKSRPYDLRLIENYNIAAVNDARWAEVNRLSLEENDPNAAYDYSLTAYKNIFDHCFPEKVAKSKNRFIPNNEWITQGLLRSCAKRSFLYKKKCRQQNFSTT